MNPSADRGKETSREWLARLRALEARLFLELLPPGFRPRRTLEVGCGAGLTTSVLAERCGTVVAVDKGTTPGAAGESRGANSTDAPPIHFLSSDAAALPFPGGSFDLLVTSNVLEHLEDLPGAFREMKRVLAPGGFMIHSVPTPAWKFWQFVLVTPGFLKTRWPRRRELARRLLDRLAPQSPGPLSPDDEAPPLLFSAPFYAPAHGRFSGSLAEFAGLSDRSWRRRFKRAGLAVLAKKELLAYTPYSFLPHRLVAPRRLLGRTALASCRAYLVAAG